MAHAAAIAEETIGYGADEQMLEVEFDRSAVFAYYDVPERVHDAFMRASSLGRYLNDEIQLAGYASRRLR